MREMRTRITPNTDTFYAVYMLVVPFLRRAEAKTIDTIRIKLTPILGGFCIQKKHMVYKGSINESLVFPQVWK